jgi:hypothetical protein
MLPFSFIHVFRCQNYGAPTTPEPQHGRKRWITSPQCTFFHNLFYLYIRTIEHPVHPRLFVQRCNFLLQCDRNETKKSSQFSLFIIRLQLLLLFLQKKKFVATLRVAFLDSSPRHLLFLLRHVVPIVNPSCRSVRIENDGTHLVKAQCFSKL